MMKFWPALALTLILAACVGAEPATRQLAFLKASDSNPSDTLEDGVNAGDGFGHCVAISGDTLVVGTPLQSTRSLQGGSGTGIVIVLPGGSESRGAVYVFRRTGSTWAQETVLDEIGSLGFAVSVSGNTILAGAPNFPEVNRSPAPGAAFIYERENSGWTRTEKLTVYGSSGFGSSVSISGDTAVVGEYSVFRNAGAVYVFRRVGIGWNLEAKLTPSTDTSGAGFGRTVANWGNTVVAGAESPESGAAYVFEREQGSWRQTARLAEGESRGFGRSISVFQDTIVVGAPGTAFGTSPEALDGAGAAYVYRRDGVSGWTKPVKLQAFNAGTAHGFGTSVAISDDHIVVGAPGESSSSRGIDGVPNARAPSSGAAYVFAEVAGEWIPRSYVKASNPGTGDDFGKSVALDAETVATGAAGEDSSLPGVNPRPNENAVDSGGAYVFEIHPLAGAYEGLIEVQGIPAGKVALTISRGHTFSATVSRLGEPKRSIHGPLPPGWDGSQGQLRIDFPALRTLPPVTMDLSIEANSELIHGTIGEASIRGFRLAESRTNSKEQICLAWRNLAPGNRSKIPGGAGFTTGWLTAKSSARLSGVLGDGFPLTLAVRLSRAGQAVVFSQPYRDKKLSMFAGIIDLSSSGTPAERQETNLLWRKAADRSFPSYREGFGITSPLPLTALWSRWAPPATVADLESSLRLGANGLTLGFGDSPESGLPATFQLADRFVLIRTTPSDGAPWSGGANPKTGRFAGTLNLVGVARRSGLSGVFLQDQLWGDLVGLGMLAIPLPGGTFQTTEVTFRND